MPGDAYHRPRRSDQGDLNALFPHDTCCRSRARDYLRVPARPTAMPALALDRSAVADTLVEKAAYYYRPPTLLPYYYGYGYRTLLWLWLSPTLLRWLWIWASLALLRGRNTDLNSRVNRSRWRKPRQGRIPPPDQPAEEPGSRPPRVAGFLLCLQSPSSEPTNLMGHAETDVRFWHKADIEREVREGRFYLENGHSLGDCDFRLSRRSLRAGVANQDGCERRNQF